MKRRLRLWLLERLGGQPQPTPLEVVQTCLKDVYVSPPFFTGMTTTGTLGSDTHIYCHCPRCRREGAE